MNRKMKVGIIINDYVVNQQIKELVDLSLTSDSYEIDCLIIQRINLGRHKNLFAGIYEYIARRGTRKFIETALFKTILLLEKSLLNFFMAHLRPPGSEAIKNFWRKHDLRDLKLESIVVEPDISQSGIIYKYNRVDLGKITHRNLDLLIRGDSGILHGDILQVCPKGIISFHHADNDINRGGPPGFWEIANKESRTGFIIQILKEELDGGDVIFKGYVPTENIYSINLAVLYTKANVFMHKMLEQLAADPLSIKVFPKKPYVYPLYTTPSIVAQAKYLATTSIYIAQKIFCKIRSRKARWSIAYQFVDHWDDVALRKCRTIKNPPHSFLADPFICFRNEKHYCFMEDYDYQSRKGCISVYEITKDGYKDLGVALREKFHLSYPFLIEHDEELYMCPETNLNKEIRLYKCDEFPLKWRLEKILLTNLAASDTNIFYKDDKWWLLTNVCSAGIQEYSSELHIYWSEQLISGNWYRHPENPVIFDPWKARNGGLLFKNKEVFRVRQKTGFMAYGESCSIAKITNISETCYEESDQFFITPHFFKNIKHTHTYSFQKGLLAIDYAMTQDTRK